MIKKIFSILILLLLFGVSVYIRLSYIQKDPAIYNANQIFMLTSLEIWENEGMTASHGVMKHTYWNQGDKFVTYYKRYMDKEGNNYFISHPYFAPIFAFGVFKAGLIPLSNSGLQELAIFLHAVTVLLLFYLLMILYKDHKDRLFISLISAGIFVIHHTVVHAYTFDYFSETWGRIFFIVSLILWFTYTKQTERTSKVISFLIGLNSFLFVYSDWLGICYMLALVFYTVIIRKSFIKYKQGLFALVIGSVAAVMLYFIQTVTLYDFTHFVKALGVRFVERSGLFGNSFSDMGYSYLNITSYKLLADKIVFLFAGIGLLPIVMFVFFRKHKGINSQNKNEILYVAFLTCLFYVLVLFNSSVIHYLLSAKWVILLSLLTASVMDRIHSYTSKIKIVIVLIFCIFSVWSVYIFNRKATTYQVPKNDEKLYSFSLQVIRHIKPEESVYVVQTNEYPFESIIYMSYIMKRNLDWVDDENSAYSKLNNSEMRTIVVLHPDFKNRLCTLSHLPGNTIQTIRY